MGAAGGTSAAGMAAALAHQYGVTIEDFIALVGGMLNPPAGRLLFFTTNHVGRLHSDILRVVDEQGARILFDNAGDVTGEVTAGRRHVR